MKIIRDILISPEVILSFCLVLVVSYFQIELTPIYSFIVNNNLNTYVLTLPAGFLYLTYNRLDLIVRPEHENKKALSKWPQFEAFRRNAYLSLVYSAVSVLLSIPLFLNSVLFSVKIDSLLGILSYLVSLITFISVYLASNELERVLNTAN